MLQLYRLSIPFRRPMTTSAGTVQRRDLILVALTRNGIQGWGEAAPWPGQTDQTADEVWASLTEPVRPLGAELGPTAEAALGAAAYARRSEHAGQPLWRVLGGAPHPVEACAAVGLIPDPDGLAAHVAELVDDGYRAVKLKIAPGWDIVPFGVVSSAFPRLAIGVDANASYRSLSDELLTLARAGPQYIEQPFPVDRPDLASQLRRQTKAVIVADEAVVDAASARRLVAQGAADVVTIKLGRLGYRVARQMAAWAKAEGVVLKVSGLFETSVGKAHTLAFATLPMVRYADFSPAASHLAADVVSDPWHVVDGAVVPRTVAGLGVTVDETALTALAPETAEVVLPASVEEVSDAGEDE